MNQFRIRWEQLHDDVNLRNYDENFIKKINFIFQAFKKIHTLNSQISDYQHVGHQITAMFEWMKHTDNTLNARLKDDVYADDVPGEAEVRIITFRKHAASVFIISRN